MTDSLPEVWLRGPVEGVPALLQPVAHALLQAEEEVKGMTRSFPGELLWERPAGVASAGFHLEHLSGVLDRLTTYAAGQSLNEVQMGYLQTEGKEKTVTVDELVGKFEQQIAAVLQQLRSTPEASLTELRRVGRKGLPSTVIGLFFHAAEHTQRHVGQLLVTIRIVKAGPEE